ncbi:MAG: glucose-6-phosphate isomerase [Gammaproteobacteria bacterium]|jgi:glucose-6-phosphate isomerase|nr:glucose-6-phosphate isomerase [Gammaproteobacteria bacterium]MDP6534769.1 glucose-6-phosphate isomerase [Gammaproteobacteria bacterium]MDP6731860.1 glucose-6-phosphate isomerase [Gammaproteobacteria bacterium]
MSSPVQTKAWQQLQKFSEEFKRKEFRLIDLFNTSDDRFEQFSLTHENLLLDYSKNLLTATGFNKLIDLAEECSVSESIEAMFNGERINRSEDRPALHVALRDAECQNPEIPDTLDRMESFVTAIQGGAWTGHTGERILDVVNLGIGGSDLGPAMVSEALSDFAGSQLKLHFVSNVDPVHLENTLAALDPATTLFIVASKSFTTLETQQNADAARQWLLQGARDDAAITRHFIAITSNRPAAEKFGIDPANLFPLWDWVGGRYSLWSAIGMPVALSIGMANFRELLAGAHSMDRHFREADLQHNMPVIMALLTIYYRGFFEAHSTAIVPYSQRLNLLPTYLQQLCMESLGKGVDVGGQSVATNSGEVIWGTAGTNGQHSYFQLLHQGTNFIPVDFIAFAKTTADDKQLAQHHLLANCFSQSLALMQGRDEPGAPHKHVPGNKSSNTLLISELNPYNLGSLIALYEHKVFVQSVIWDINAFDQWGVELGKILSRDVYTSLLNDNSDNQFDDSTCGLIELVKQWSEQ